MKQDYCLYSTVNGVVFETNGVRRRIMDELQVMSRSMTELSKMTGRAQSTLSVHLDKMVSDGLVECTTDPSDNRRKIYAARATLIANSKFYDVAARDLSLEVLQSSVDDPSKNIFVSLLLEMDGMGISVGPMIKTLGRNVAVSVEGNLSGAEIDVLFDRVKAVYSKLGLGDVSVYNKEPLTVIIRNPNRLTRATAEVLGMFNVGFFTELLGSLFGSMFRVEDSEVFGAENNYYRITIN